MDVVASKLIPLRFYTLTLRFFPILETVAVVDFRADLRKFR